MLTLQGVHAISRKTLPTKSAGKRQASAEHALSDRAKRQSRCPDTSEPLYASEEDANFEERARVSSGSLLVPTPSSALKSSGEKAKQYPIAILLPLEDDRNIRLHNNDIPAELATFLRGEVDKWLDNALRIKWWNSIYHENYADCMLTQAVCIIGVDYSRTLEGQHATRACSLCVDPSISGLSAPRPCVVLRKDAKGELYMLFLPLMPYMRKGKGWLERGFWMNESKHPYIPRPYPEDAYRSRWPECPLPWWRVRR